ncbi:hypothetical protein CAEBREN_06637 [Caenorhabditis brenneri]|uniref:G-protein coupled receptors family 1 profile domain-containing protein n=1 Tax=Caenorhabditis brenneri TaxID=135651 RepID=G0M9R5_CAEBE|nr:hypothetical protein CAEBREN_06637 [Caenorhabditis brenneri]
MRTCSTNSLIIMIGFCDLTALSVIISDRTLHWIIQRNSCINSKSFYLQLFTLLSRVVKENSNWISFWLGVSLALIRLIILKSTSTSLWIARNSIGFLVFLNIAAINIFVSIWVYSGIQIAEVSELWTPPGGCPKLKEGYYEQSFILSPGTVEQEKRYVDKYKLYVGISQMSISIIYPVLDLLLFLEIRKSAIRIAQSNHSGALERHHTGRLVLFLSLSYLITCTPTAILWLTQYLVVIKRESILELLIGYGSIFASVLFCLNTISQCVICYLVSSKYRETARMLLGIKEKVIFEERDTSNVKDRYVETLRHPETPTSEHNA